MSVPDICHLGGVLVGCIGIGVLCVGRCCRAVTVNVVV